MKKVKTISVLLLFGVVFLYAQLETAYPQTWFASGSRPDDYEMGGDPTVSHGTDSAGFIRSKVSEIDGFGTWMTKIEPGKYAGHGIRMTAFVKTTDVENWAGLWLRVDGAGGKQLSFDNMGNRPIKGTTDWQQYEIILDVPENSTGIFYGIILNGTGEAWIDGLQSEIALRTWLIQKSGITRPIFAIAAVDANTVWAGADKSIYLRTIDGGEHWEMNRIAVGDTMVFFSIAAIDQNTAYFIGQNYYGGDGRIYKTSDGGENWTLQYQNTTPGVFLSSIAFWDENHGLAVSDPVNGSFLILTTTDGGDTWTQVPTENIPAPLPNEFAGLPGQGGTLLTVEGTHNAWFGNAYPIANNQPIRIFRSTDQGQHWTAVNTPLPTDGGFRGIPTIVFKDSLNGLAGYVDLTNPPNPAGPPALLKTIDGGKSWTIVPSFLPIHPLTIAYVPQTNHSALFVTSRQGTAYSADGGVTWKILNTQLHGPLAFASPTAGWAAGRPNGRIVKFAGQPATEVIVQQEQYPAAFELRQNYPNPFNPCTTIAYSIAQSGFIELKIYDILGNEIQTVINAFQPAGNYRFDFDASQLASGIYFYRLQVEGNFSETMKMLIIK